MENIFTYMKCGARHPWSSSGCQVAEMCDMAKPLLLVPAKVFDPILLEEKGVRSDPIAAVDLIYLAIKDYFTPSHLLQWLISSSPNTHNEGLSNAYRHYLYLYRYISWIGV